MTDVETRLRTTFAADAEGAPDADLLALAGAVRGTVRRQRRRRVSVAAAVAVLVVAGGALVVPRVLTVTTLPATQPAPAGPLSSPRPSPSSVEEPALRWRGVVVPVPESYLRPDAVRCGVPVIDAAYVDRPGDAVRRCLARPADEARQTTVVLSSWDTSALRRPPAPEQVLRDGRTRLTTRVPGAPVMLTVTSPDAALARRLFEGTRIEPPADCPVEATGAPPDRVGNAPPELGGDPVAVSVCSYTDGWLDSWSSNGSATYLMLLLRAPVPPGPRRTTVCDGLSTPASEDHWLVTLHGTGPAFAVDGTLRLWVAAGPCHEAGVHTPDGGLVPLTQPLVDFLRVFAPGIDAVSDVVGGPKS